ncbi:MAG: iron-containing alcohol dehydrogenase [Kiritimatiellia bacterium]|jgi:alcohol dehydrogenase YqhD (iron-dependent ADH family)|nr:iron-containing alcohol dehydrogenase [Kiritimatiellia bacterium]
MNPFEYQNPVRVVFGAGVVARLGGEAAKYGKQALVVSYAEHAALREVLDRACALLSAAGVRAETFYEVAPNPEIGMIARGVARAKACRADLVIGIGGGSAMDAAKAIAAGALYEGDLWNMVYSRHDDVRAVPPARALPTLMVPTLSATGSEMNMCAVVTNAALQEKSYIWSDCLFPKTALLDPGLTYSLPPFQTACGAVDTISHVLEIYINGQERSGLLHAWQEGVMRTVVRNLPLALADPCDAEARAELMWCATCALNGWASPGDAWTPMHQVGHVLTTRHSVNHGTSLALIMPAWMEHFKARKPGRYHAFARNVMKVDPHGKTRERIIDEGIAAFRSFIESAGLPTRLSQVGVSGADLPAIVADVKKVSFNAEGVLACTPPVGADELLQILVRAS